MCIFKKRLVALYSMCMLCQVLIAATYTVNVNRTLNMRILPNANSKVVCQLNNGDVIEGEVWQSDMTWTKCTYNGLEGYVKSEYLTLTDERETAILQKPLTLNTDAIGQFINRLFHSDGQGTSNWLLYVLLAEIICMWIISKFIRKTRMDMLFSNEGFDNPMMKYCTSGLMLITSLTIFFYLHDNGENALRFMTGSWQKIIIGGVASFYAFANMIVFVIKTIDDFTYAAKNHVNLVYGILAWIFGIGGILVSCFIKPEWLNTVLWIEGVMQLIQVGVIFFSITKNGNFLNALLACITYIVGSFAVIIVVMPFVVLAIVLIIALLVLVLVIYLRAAEDAEERRRDKLPRAQMLDNNKIFIPGEGVEEIESRTGSTVRTVTGKDFHEDGRRLN